MSLLAGLSQQGDSIAAHNADASAHGFGVYTVAQLNAFTSANRPTGCVYCSDCLVRDGVGSPVVWNGTQWVCTCSGLPATTDLLTFFRGVRRAGLQASSDSTSVEILRPTRFGQSWGVAVGTGAGSSPGGDLGTLFFSTGSTSTGYSGGTTYNFIVGAPGVADTNSARTPAALYYANSLSCSALSSATDEYLTLSGFTDVNTGGGIGTFGALVAYDRGNTLGANAENTHNLIAIARASSVSTPVLSSVPMPTDRKAGVLVEILFTPGRCQFYANGTIFADITTNLPVLSNLLQPRSLIIKTVGTTSRSLSTYREVVAARF
jgi:hypothetical protein